MAGLRRIAKLYGGLTINGVHYVWDYAADEPVPVSEMPEGSERWKASERIRWKTPQAAKATESGKDRR